MNVIIAGAGEVGIYIAEKVTAESHDVTIIEIDPAKVREISNTLDVNVIPGNASSVQILKKAMVQNCDLFLSLTNNEEVNIVSASIANRLGAKKTIARFDNTDFRKTSEFSYQSHFGINEMFSSEMFASLEMDSFIRNPGSLAIEHFAQGTVIMRQVIIDENSRYTEKEVSKLDMPKDVKIACITRDGRLIIPKGDTLLKAGDSILLIGETEKINKFQRNFKWGKVDTRKIVILGGGRITLNLARRLNSKLFRLSIIERDPWRCERLSSELPYATVLQGDGTKLELLMEEHVETADFFIAATANDEINIMS
ncbi:MAG: Trk system potassium transporter TrkA, partial [Deltaproteobacteria bacterium]|nr:Trk system potassium transporter TrkA [Deltaproteobacteria bacterium]